MANVAANPSSIVEFLTPTKGIKASSLAGATPGDSFKNFLEVAMQMAQIDEAITSARASAPSKEDTEASKWHEVSIKALMWTRSSVAEQQGIALGQLKDSAVSQRSSALPSPQVSSAMSSFSMAATAAPFSPIASKPMTGVKASLSKLLTPAQAGTQVVKGELNVGSLRDDLERLKEYDAQQCLIVRRIKRLGLGSPEILRKHFSSFGGVKEILISHSFEKKSAKCRADRVRPAALGFIIMDSVDGAQEVLRAGPTIMIGDVDVEVKIFEPLEQLQQRDGTDAQPSGLANFQ